MLARPVPRERLTTRVPFLESRGMQRLHSPGFGQPMLPERRNIIAPKLSFPPGGFPAVSRIPLGGRASGMAWDPVWKVMPAGRGVHPPKDTVSTPLRATIRKASRVFSPSCRSTSHTSRPDEIASPRACSSASMTNASPVRRAPESRNVRHAGNESAVSRPSSPRTASSSSREKPFLTGRCVARRGG